MRTTLELDDDLMRGLLGMQPGASKREAVENAIRWYLGQDAAERIIALRGKLDIKDLSAELRAIDRHI